MILIQYSQRHSVINHCDKHITHLVDLDISFALLDIFLKCLLHLECYLNYHPKGISKQVNRLNRSKDISVSLRRVIRLSQWFIRLCFWLYCISITKKSDKSITVIYHAMSLTVLYQYHWDEWYVYHSDLSWYVSDCTVSLRWVICLSQWFITLCFWLYCISITEMSDMSITVIYHAMFLTVL